MIEEREDLYGAASPQALAAETYDNYKQYVNPPLARVMKVSGSPVEVRARGCTIWDQTGKAYLDFAGGYGVFTLGYSHPRVLEAVRMQMELISLSGKTMFNVMLGRAARRLAEIAPGDLQISFWCNSGTEAIEGAIKLARAATGRAKIVGTLDAYHGKTLGALSVSGRESFQTPFRPLLADSVAVPFGETDGLEATLADAAAFVVEPVQGEGGVNVPRPGYLQAVREICDRTHTVFVADEVQTGLGRCGYRFGCDRDGVVPDVMTLAKGLSGGVIPVGAFIARPDVWHRAFGHAPLVHTSTFGGGELACAAALAAMDVLEDEGLAEQARIRGEQLLRGARAIADAYPTVVREARGLGLLVGVELTHEGYGGFLIPEMLKAGVTAAWTLNQQRVIRLEPPLIVTASEIERALSALRDAVAAAHDKLERFPRNAMPYVESKIVIAAPAEVVYELAKDQERFPQFMPDVETVTVIERTPNGAISRWKTLVEEAPIEWTEEDRFDDAALRIDYKLLEGDLDKFEGAWTFEHRDGATHVVLGVDYDFGVPTLAELIGPTLQKKVRENSEMMLAALKRQAEQT